MPVTKLESSEARNTAALATSSGSPMRPIGMVATSLAMMSGGWRSIRGVLIGPGAQDIRANATVLQLHGPGSHQIANRRFGSAVGTEGSCAFDTRDGADENDRPSVVHQWQGLLHREQRALHVEIEKLVEMRLCEACQWGGFADGGIGDQDIDLPLPLHRLVESIEVLQFGSVSLNACDAAPDCLHGLVELLPEAAGYEDIGAFIDEPLRRRNAYSRGASGNHGQLSL